MIGQGYELEELCVYVSRERGTVCRIRGPNRSRSLLWNRYCCAHQREHMRWGLYKEKAAHGAP